MCAKRLAERDAVGMASRYGYWDNGGWTGIGYNNSLLISKGYVAFIVQRMSSKESSHGLWHMACK
jgi:hypothetical protein